MRGRGRVYRPTNGSGKPSAVYMLDYTITNCPCADCRQHRRLSHRFRESSGVLVKNAKVHDAYAEMERRIAERQAGRSRLRGSSFGAQGP
jgi:hypothetical protein